MENRTTIEVQEGEGKWREMGPIHLMDNPGNQKEAPTPALPTEKNAHRKELSIDFKHILSPNARIKAHRKANYLYRHSSDKVDTNLLVFLHGAGDQHTLYHALAKQMALPQTCTLCLHASSMGGFVKLPFDFGHTWFEQMDYTTGDALHATDPRLKSSLKKAVDKLDLLIDTLIEKEGWVAERIFLFGFSAGACLAMETALNRFIRGKQAFGGAVCVAGGCVPQRDKDSSNHKASEQTPVLILGGSKDDTFPPNAVNNAMKTYNEHKANMNPARVYIKEGKGHAMVQSPQEMEVVMKFFAEHMVKKMLGWKETSNPFPKNHK